MSAKLNEYNQLLNEYVGVLDAFDSSNGVSVPDMPLVCTSLNSLLLDENVADQTLINIVDIDFESINSYISDISEKGKWLQKNVKELRADYSNGVFSVDAEKLLSDYNSLSKAFFIKKNIGLGKIVKIINSNSIGSKKCSKQIFKTGLQKILY